jgi:hypothetical protein
MKNFFIERQSVGVSAFILGLILVLTLTTTALAQGQGQSGGSSGSGLGDQTRDRIQDPALHEGDYEPAQDRDRDRLQDGTGDNCTASSDCDGVPDQDRLREQDQDRLQDGTGDGVPERDRDRTQDRLRVDSVTALQEYVREQNRIRLQEESATGTQVQTRTEARVAMDAIEVAEPLLGQRGPRMSEVAREMGQTVNELAAQELRLENRGRLQRFFFGQDDEVVATMQQEMEQNQNRIEEMKQYLSECEDCDEETVEYLASQIQNMEQEHNRLRLLIDNAAEQDGLFGFLFGWLR